MAATKVCIFNHTLILYGSLKEQPFTGLLVEYVFKIPRYDTGVTVEQPSTGLLLYCVLGKAYTVTNISERTAIHLAATRLSVKLTLILKLISQKAAFIKATNWPCVQ